MYPNQERFEPELMPCRQVCYLLFNSFPLHKSKYTVDTGFFLQQTLLKTNPRPKKISEIRGDKQTDKQTH